MDKSVLITHSVEDTEFASNLSKKLADKQISCNLVNSDFINQLPETTGVVVILSENYLSQPWITSILEKERIEVFNDLNLVLVLLNPTIKIPKVFAGGSRCTNIAPKELPIKVYLYLKGILKDATDSPLSLARNLM